MPKNNSRSSPRVRLAFRARLADRLKYAKNTPVLDILCYFNKLTSDLTQVEL